MTAFRTYRRPMAGWWRRNPFYVRYMAREISSVFVTLYALVLLCGLYRLTQGKAAYEAWLQALSAPLAVGFHVAAFAAFTWHVWTWFQVMPRTMAAPRIGGKAVADWMITGAGLAAALAGTVVTLMIVSTR